MMEIRKQDEEEGYEEEGALQFISLFKYQMENYGR
jgi:hypothetical protein